MRVKTGLYGARIRGIRPETVIGMLIAESVYQKRGHELTITEATGGHHKFGSLHYAGLAFDARVHEENGDPFADIDALVSDLRNALGDEWDVVKEADHIHVEYQPKK